jgi:hypothetical protein
MSQDPVVPESPAPGPAADPQPTTGYQPYQPYQPYPPGYSAYPPAPQTDDKAVWALVSAIAGFLVCPIVLHIVGLVLANQSLRAIRASGGRIGGDGIAGTARVLSIIGLVVYGAVLVLGLIFLLIALPLGLFTLGTVANDVEAEQVTVQPTAVVEIDGQQFDHDAGDITYDFSAVDFTDRTVETGINVGAGSLLVEVPEDVTVVLDAQVGGGQLDVFGSSTDGVGLDRTDTFEGTPEGGTIELDVDMGVGEVTLARTG